MELACRGWNYHSYHRCHGVTLEGKVLIVGLGETCMNRPGSFENEFVSSLLSPLYGIHPVEFNHNLNDKNI